mmetsp:Transcript_33558/g.44301  ORF Transcript_33558/g.44301 Transcript_33558/m.44301 type:complete len:832 (-) Transcript_33558:202-2697(-)
MMDNQTDSIDRKRNLQSTSDGSPAPAANLQKNYFTVTHKRSRPEKDLQNESNPQSPCCSGNNQKYNVCAECDVRRADIRLSCNHNFHARCIWNFPIRSCPKCGCKVEEYPGVHILPLEPHISNDLRDELSTEDKKKSKLRVGRWHLHETLYAENICEGFSQGLLPLSEGTKLCPFLCKLLRCQAARLSKKMKIGKKHFKPHPRSGCGPEFKEQFKNQQKKVSELEELFLLEEGQTQGGASKVAFLSHNIQVTWRELFIGFAHSVNQKIFNAFQWNETALSMPKPSPGLGSMSGGQFSGPPSSNSLSSVLASLTNLEKLERDHPHVVAWLHTLFPSNLPLPALPKVLLEGGQAGQDREGKGVQRPPVIMPQIFQHPMDRHKPNHLHSIKTDPASPPKTSPPHKFEYLPRSNSPTHQQTHSSSPATGTGNEKNPTAPTPEPTREPSPPMVAVVNQMAQPNPTPDTQPHPRNMSLGSLMDLVQSVSSMTPSPVQTPTPSLPQVQGHYPPQCFNQSYAALPTQASYSLVQPQQQPMQPPVQIQFNHQSQQVMPAQPAGHYIVDKRAMDSINEVPFENVWDNLHDRLQDSFGFVDVAMDNRLVAQRGPSQPVPSRPPGSKTVFTLEGSPSEVHKNFPEPNRRFQDYIEQFLETIPFEAVDIWVPVAAKPGEKNAQSPITLCHAGHFSLNEGNLKHWGNYSTSFSFPEGVGLPGRVYRARFPAWKNIKDMTQESFLRKKGAMMCGINTAFGVPMTSCRGVTFVIVFYSQQELIENANVKLFIERTVQTWDFDNSLTAKPKAKNKKPEAPGSVSGDSTEEDADPDNVEKFEDPMDFFH